MKKRLGKAPVPFFALGVTVLIMSFSALLSFLAAAEEAAQNTGPLGGATGSFFVNGTVTATPDFSFLAKGDVPAQDQYIGQALGFAPGSATITGQFICGTGLSSSNVITTANGIVVDRGGAFAATLPNAYVTNFASCGSTIVAVVSSGELATSSDCGQHFTLKNPLNLPMASNGYASVISARVSCPVDLGPQGRAPLAANPSVILLGFGGPGVYRSTDGGNTFAASNTGLPTGSVAALTFLSAAGKLFLGTNAGVFSSADQGASWSAANTGLPSGSLYVPALATDGIDLYAAVNSAVYKSMNGGASWVQTGYAGTGTFNWLYASGGTVVAGTSAGLFESTDGGATWLSGDEGRVQTNVLALATQGSNVIASTDGIPNGAFVSTAQGISWQRSNTTLDGLQLSGLVATASAIVGVSPFGAYRSTDGGLTWTRVASFPTPGGGSPPVVTSSGGSLLATNYKDLYRSVDGGASFAKFDGNLNTAQSYYGFSSIASVGNALFIGAGVYNQGLLRSLDGGNTWQPCAGAPTENFIAIGGPARTPA